jgi:hypothetical protein
VSQHLKVLDRFAEVAAERRLSGHPFVGAAG